MGTTPQALPPSNPTSLPAEGSRRLIDQVERVFYSGYWVKTYPVPGDTLKARKDLIESTTRRLFNHTEHGLNVPGARLREARTAYDAETDPGKRRVKGAMLAGALFNRAADIFRRLVDLQADGVDIGPDYPLVHECGECLVEALELGRYVLHRSGDEGIDELWGEPFRAFSIPLEEYYECRYVKTAGAMRDIEHVVHEFARAARVKTETLRSDADIFEVWARFVTAGERLANFAPAASPGDGERPSSRSAHSVSDGLQLIRSGRALVFYIARARTSMPKSTQEFIERCEFYRANGRVPILPATLPD